MSLYYNGYAIMRFLFVGCERDYSGVERTDEQEYIWNETVGVPSHLVALQKFIAKTELQNWKGDVKIVHKVCVHFWTHSTSATINGLLP